MRDTEGYWPYLLCKRCVDLVTPEEMALLDDPAYQPGKATWEMTPMSISF